MHDIPIGYDIKRWSDQKVRDYHVVIKLSQFLGLDPLNFEFLDKNFLFPGGYARHHFRDIPRRRLSTNARDVILNDKNKHIEYEKYSEGQMVALLNTLIGVMYAKDASGKFTKEITPKQLYDTLVKHMTPYAKDILPLGAKKRDILVEVRQQAKVFWDIWNDKDTFQATFDPQTGEYNGLSRDFLKRLKELNTRRDKYLKTGKYEELLQVEYGLDPNSRRVKNARDFHIVLSPNNELGDDMCPTYIDERGYQFMEQGLLDWKRGQRADPNYLIYPS
jgi:hypothetical protein